MYDFDVLLPRRNTDSTKWDALQRDFGRDDLMPFWVADIDFPILPEINEVIRSRAADGQTFGYTFAGQGYFESVIAWNKTRHGLSLEKKDILPIPGVVTALAVILMALTKINDKVLINPPVYTPFFDVVNGLGRELILSPLKQEDGRYTFDFEDLKAKLSSGVSAYVLCSPHNPVGRVWEEAELREVAALCREYNVCLISDEIHYDIVFSGHKHHPILSICPEAIMITAPSKTFNIAGLKSSVILVKEPTLRERVDNWADNLHLYCNLFAYQASQVAYEKGAQWVNEMNAYLEDNARYTVEYLKTHLPSVKAYVPESTYLMWLDCSELHLCGKDLNDILVNKAGTALNSGEEYGEGYDKFVRLNIATPRYYLMEGLEKIVKALAF